MSSRRKVFKIDSTTPISRQLQYRDLDCLVYVDIADGAAVLPKSNHESRGMRVTMFVKTISDGVGATITPDAGDTIVGDGLTALSAGQAIKNTAATDEVGDRVTLESVGNGIWAITEMAGTWAGV